MIFDRKAYKAIDPVWGVAPLSGDGAALKGGRFNPKGTPALYLSLDPVTALNEVAQGFAGRIAPCTVCEYVLDCDDIVDLTSEANRSAMGTSMEVLACAWKLLRPAPSQELARRLIAEGTAGILVPSFAIGARPDQVNLVLWTWGQAKPHKVEVFDPTGRLPKNQLSWS